MRATIGLVCIASILGSTFTSATANTDIAKVRTVEKIEYHIEEGKSATLHISAVGKVNSSGWTGGELAPWVYVERPKDGILDVDFIAKPPRGFVMWVISPISAELTGPLEPWIKGVRVHSSTNIKEVQFDDAAASIMQQTDSSASNGEKPLPWPWNYEVDGHDASGADQRQKQLK